MGRSKVIVKHIDDPVKRKATFQKRKGGVMKKAMELSVLCGCDIAFVMFVRPPPTFYSTNQTIALGVLLRATRRSEP